MEIQAATFNHIKDLAMTVVIIGEKNSSMENDITRDKKVTISADVHKEVKTIQQIKSPQKLNENSKTVVPNLSLSPFEVSIQK